MLRVTVSRRHGKDSVPVPARGEGCTISFADKPTWWGLPTALQRAEYYYSQINKLVPRFSLLLPPPGFDSVLKKQPLFSEYLLLLHEPSHAHSPKHRCPWSRSGMAETSCPSLPDPHAILLCRYMLSRLKQWYLVIALNLYSKSH